MTLADTTKLHVDKGTRFLEKNIALLIGSSVAYQIEYIGASSVSSVTANVYRKKKDITSAVMPSGSVSTSGNIVTLKPLVPASTDGRKKYELSVQATVDGNTFVTNATIKILRRTDTL